MRIFRAFLAAALAAFFFGTAVWAADEDGVMGTDNMGNGAEYGSGEDRALQIDEAGDGDYNTGDGSVVETSSDAASGSDDTE